MPGWGGWACHQRNCPVGDPATLRHGSGGLSERQRVVCSLDNEEEGFTLNVLNGYSARIGAKFNALQIRRALEYRFFLFPLPGIRLWFLVFVFCSVLSTPLPLFLSLLSNPVFTQQPNNPFILLIFSHGVIFLYISLLIYFFICTALVWEM